MANSTAMARLPERRLEVAKQVDEIAADAAQALAIAGGGFAAELAVAQAIGDMRDKLTADVIAPIMALQNTALGFLTDNRSGYAAAEVRDVFIEAKIRGFRAYGNEFNIIKGKFYAAKAGLRRKVLELVTDFRDTYGVPKSGNGGAVVSCKATWRRDGQADALEADVPVKGDGADLILGKAERKFLARIYSRLSGINTPDGDPDEGAIDVTAAPTMSAPPRPSAPPAPQTGPGPALDTQRAKQIIAESPPEKPAAPAQEETAWSDPAASPLVLSGALLRATEATTLAELEACVKEVAELRRKGLVPDPEFAEAKATFAAEGKRIRAAMAKPASAAREPGSDDE